MEIANEKAFNSEHVKNKIGWRKSIFTAIESFKDYKLESVEQYKKSLVL